MANRKRWMMTQKEMNKAMTLRNQGNGTCKEQINQTPFFSSGRQISDRPKQGHITDHQSGKHIDCDDSIKIRGFGKRHKYKNLTAQTGRSKSNKKLSGNDRFVSRQITEKPQRERRNRQSSQILYPGKKFVMKDIPLGYRDWETDRKSTRLNSSHRSLSRMPSSA